MLFFIRYTLKMVGTSWDSWDRLSGAVQCRLIARRKTFAKLRAGEKPIMARLTPWRRVAGRAANTPETRIAPWPGAEKCRANWVHCRHPHPPQTVGNFSGETPKAVDNFPRNFAHSENPNKYRYLRIAQVTYNMRYVKYMYK